MEKLAAEKKKMAVLVGCNYEGTKYRLHGCHNDVLSMRDVLIKRFGFGPESIELIVDQPGCSVLPTASNIKSALGRMVDRAEPGDVLFFHFSGHGTLLGKRHSREEAIVGLDFNFITSVDFREIVNRVPKGAIFTILSDSCHSGGLIDKEKEQIGPQNDPTGDLDNRPLITNGRKSKFIPPDSLVQHLSSLTNINNPDIGTHVLELFKDEASLSFQLPHGEIDEKTRRLEADEGILLSGCQADEVSEDVQDGEGKAYGAFSNAVQSVLKEHEGDSVVISNKELVLMARRFLKMKHSQQHPCLYCSDANAEAPFLAHPQV